jgi:dolichol kinase
MGIIPEDEIKRKLFHLLMLIYVAAYWVLEKTLVLKLLGVVIIFVLICDIVRLRVPSFNTWLLRFLGGVHRDHETNNLSGLPWTLLGSFFTILIFPDKKIVVVSFLYLAFGDAMAAIVGRVFGRRKTVRSKTVAGSVACFVACLLAGLPFLPWPLALAGAVAATLIEVVPWPLNDNFWMPLASAGALTALLAVARI